MRLRRCLLGHRHRDTEDRERADDGRDQARLRMMIPLLLVARGRTTLVPRSWLRRGRVLALDFARAHGHRHALGLLEGGGRPEGFRGRRSFAVSTSRMSQPEPCRTQPEGLPLDAVGERGLDGDPRPSEDSSSGSGSKSAWLLRTRAVRRSSSPKASRPTSSAWRSRRDRNGPPHDANSPRCRRAASTRATPRSGR